MVFGAIGVVLSLSGLLCSVKNAKLLCTIAVSVALVFSLIYTILGIVYAEAVEVIISEEELSVSVSTYSYFSFVAVLVAGVLYFVTAPNFATAPKTDKVAKSSQSQILEEKELKTVEVLLRYKELFDRGVITEQEYENKKRALLGESKENKSTGAFVEDGNSGRNLPDHRRGDDIVGTKSESCIVYAFDCCKSRKSTERRIPDRESDSGGRCIFRDHRRGCIRQYAEEIHG